MNEQQLLKKTWRLYLKLKFNRPINTDTDWISFDGITLGYQKEGSQEICFCCYEGLVDTKDPSILHMQMREPDYECYPNMRNLDLHHLSDVSSIEDLSIYIDTDGEIPFFLDSILKMEFFIWNPAEGKWDCIKVPESVVKTKLFSKQEENV